MPVKAKYIKDLPLKRVLDGSESLLVQDLNGTQQAPLGTIVDEIKQNSQEKIREIKSELAQTNAQLSSKMDKDGEIIVSQINKNKGKFDQTYMTDEFLQQMAGTTPINAVPADGSLTNAKYADGSISASKLDESSIKLMNKEALGVLNRFDGSIYATDEEVDNYQFRKSLGLFTNQDEKSFHSSANLEDSYELTSKYESMEGATLPLPMEECPLYLKWSPKYFGSSSPYLTYYGLRVPLTGEVGKVKHTFQFWINKGAINRLRTWSGFSESYNNADFMFALYADQSAQTTDVSYIIDINTLNGLEKGDIYQYSSNTSSFEVCVVEEHGEFVCIQAYTTINSAEGYSYAIFYIRPKADSMEREGYVISVQGEVVCKGHRKLNPYKAYNRQLLNPFNLEFTGDTNLPETVNNNASASYRGEDFWKDLHNASLSYLDNEDDEIFSKISMPKIINLTMKYEPSAERNCLMYMGVKTPETKKSSMYLSLWVNKTDMGKVHPDFTVDFLAVNRGQTRPMRVRDFKLGAFSYGYSSDSINGVGSEQTKNAFSMHVDQEVGDWLHVTMRFDWVFFNNAHYTNDAVSKTTQEKLYFRIHDTELRQEVTFEKLPLAHDFDIRIKGITVSDVPLNPYLLYGVNAVEIVKTEAEAYTDGKVEALRATHEEYYHAPKFATNIVNAVKGSYTTDLKLDPLKTQRKYTDDTSDSEHNKVEYVYNKEIYKKYGIPNTVKITVGDDSSRYQPLLTHYITLEDLADIGVVPDDENPPVISMRGFYVKDSYCNMEDQSRLQIWYALRYADGTDSIPHTYATSKDVTFVNDKASGNHLGLGDDFWQHQVETVNNEHLYGWVHRGIKVPATYNGKPLQSIGIRFIGYRLTPAEQIPSSFETCLVALTKGDDLATFDPMFNNPLDFESPYKINESTEGENEGVNVVNIQNSDKVVLIGDSYSACHYTLKGKAYIHSLSQYSDYNFENFARSGDDYGEMFERLSKRTPEFHESLSIDKYGGDYALLLSNENDGYYTGVDLRYYHDNLNKLVDGVRSLGMHPIVCTEFSNGTADSRQVKGLHQKANELGADFIDIATKTKISNPKKYAPFWGNGHPATRTTYLFSDEIQKGLDRILPRPKQSLKIFRKRREVAVNDINDLLFTDINSRAELFKEIHCGHYALSDSTREYYDDLDVRSSNSKVISEYLKLQNHENVELTEYSLVDVVVNSTSKGVNTFQLNLDVDQDIEVYIHDFKPAVVPDYYAKYRAFVCSSSISGVMVGDVFKDSQDNQFTVHAILNNNTLRCTPFNVTPQGNTLTRVSGAGTVNSITFSKHMYTYSDGVIESMFKPTGQWYKLKVDEGVVSVDDKDLIRRVMNYDKLTFLIKAQSSFNLKDINFTWTGKEGKVLTHPKLNDKRESVKEELLATTKFDQISDWIVKGVVAPYTPVDGVMPRGVNTIIDVTPTNTVKQRFNLEQNEEVVRTCQVKIWARVFPEKHSYTKGFDNVSSSITEDSYDNELIIARISDSTDGEGNTNCTAYFKDVVGLHWKQVVFNFDVATYTSTQEIEIMSKNKAIQIASVSVKYLD